MLIAKLTEYPLIQLTYEQEKYLSSHEVINMIKEEFQKLIS